MFARRILRYAALVRVQLDRRGAAGRRHRRAGRTGARPRRRVGVRRRRPPRVDRRRLAAATALVRPPPRPPPPHPLTSRGPPTGGSPLRGRRPPQWLPLRAGSEGARSGARGTACRVPTGRCSGRRQQPLHRAGERRISRRVVRVTAGPGRPPHRPGPGRRSDMLGVLVYANRPTRGRIGLMDLIPTPNHSATYSADGRLPPRRGNRAGGRPGYGEGGPLAAGHPRGGHRAAPSPPASARADGVVRLAVDETVPGGPRATGSPWTRPPASGSPARAPRASSGAPRPSASCSAPTPSGAPRSAPGEWRVPACHLTDAPRFGWRGFMLDVARHFMPKDVRAALPRPDGRPQAQRAATCT